MLVCPELPGPPHAIIAVVEPAAAIAIAAMSHSLNARRRRRITMNTVLHARRSSMQIVVNRQTLPSLDAPGENQIAAYERLHPFIPVTVMPSMK
jgi:hypothetical protein